MVHHTDPKLIELLRSQHRDGRTSADLLRLLDDRGLDMVESMDHFRIAFGLDSYDVAPIGGWFADGTGELNDAAVSDLLDRAIAAADRTQTDVPD